MALNRKMKIGVIGGGAAGMMAAIKYWPPEMVNVI